MDKSTRGKPVVSYDPVGRKDPCRCDTDFEYIEFVETDGKHSLRLRPTGEIIGSFINHWEALRAAEAADRALKALFGSQERTGDVSPLPSLSEARAAQKFKRAKSGPGI
ncbi:MAG: hypothetical protein M0R18_05325 [Deltaproteobacteria bacterium]|jgi:hypothetical protein|nr:hypothetical protein [Deltaproteobacteria bacterium]HPW69279.1 hypothetical protein [Deltaproteobacteria bacterium]